jgi:hypothetical protein
MACYLENCSVHMTFVPGQEPGGYGTLELTRKESWYSEIVLLMLAKVMRLRANRSSQ